METIRADEIREELNSHFTSLIGKNSLFKSVMGFNLYLDTSSKASFPGMKIVNITFALMYINEKYTEKVLRDKFFEYLNEIYSKKEINDIKLTINQYLY